MTGSYASIFIRVYGLARGRVGLFEHPAIVADAQAAGRRPTQDDGDRDDRESCVFRRGYEFVDRQHNSQKSREIAGYPFGTRSMALNRRTDDG
jgi:hypothetical protein